MQFLVYFPKKNDNAPCLTQLQLLATLQYNAIFRRNLHCKFSNLCPKPSSFYKEVSLESAFLREKLTFVVHRFDNQRPGCSSFVIQASCSIECIISNDKWNAPRRVHDAIAKRLYDGLFIIRVSGI